MWHIDNEINEECCEKIRKIYSIRDKHYRFLTVIKEICSATATSKLNDENFRNWVGTMTMAALHPNEFFQIDRDQEEKIKNV